MRYPMTALVWALLLTGCGGGSSNETANSGGSAAPTYTAGVYNDENQYKNYCAAPRIGKSPYTGETYPDKQGSLLHEQLFLRSWSQRTYLWYRELSDINPAGYTSAEAYFDVLKTSGLSESGAAKDKFHFSEPTSDYEQSNVSEVVAGYGVQWAIRAARPPRQVYVAYAEAGSPADVAGLARGDLILTVDGVDVVNGNTSAIVDTINAGLFPAKLNETHTLSVRTQAGTTKSVQLRSAEVTMRLVRNSQVLLNSKGAKVGYVQFNGFSAPAQADLIASVQQFVQQGVQDVVLDLRYNGGGSLALSSQLAYMLSGPNVVQGRLYNKLTFNDKYTSTDPVTGAALSPIPFYTKEIDYNAGKLLSTDLPTLNIRRLYVLATGRTCSASEALVNGLRGVDMEVLLIGETTCGKPYGFYPTSNCGTTYYTVQFKGSNAKGYGDYSDGLIPTPTPSRSSDVKGCKVNDDFSQPLGSRDEGLLATALHHSAGDSCPAVALAAPMQVAPLPDETQGLSIQTDKRLLQDEAVIQSIH